MKNTDRRGILEEEIFTTRTTKKGEVFLYWRGQQVKVLSPREGEKLLRRLEQAQNGHEKQLLLAKVTGNFKRGNEKLGKA